MKKSDKLPAYVWVNRVNLSGLYSRTPLAARLDEDDWYDKKPRWISRDGNILVQRFGTRMSDGCIEFASVDKREVEAWTAGAVAAFTLLDRWAKWGSHDRKPKEKKKGGKK